jgi:hypothetical protein
MKSFDQLVNDGSQLLDDNGGRPVEAYGAYDTWVHDTHKWLSQHAPNSGLTGEWAAFGSSPLVYGGAYYDEPQAWVSHLALVRRRLKWLAEKGSVVPQTETVTNRKRALAKLAALRDQVRDAVSFDWSDLHYSSDLTLEFFERYAALRDEFRSIDPELFADLPLRDLPSVPAETGDGLIKGQLPTRYLRTLLGDMDYILRIHSELAKISTAPNLRLDTNSPEFQSWDVFISHATEDKEAVAEPLSRALMKAGVSVWYDTFALKVGDSLMSSIDLGLRKSKFGIVILSPAFFRKDWPQRELRALGQKQSASQKVILPVWHDVSADDVRDHFLLLADVVALKWIDGIQTVVDGLLDVIAGGVRRPNNGSSEQFQELATMSPRQGIAEKWKELVQAILDAGARNPVLMKAGEENNPSEVVNALFSKELLSKSDQEAFFSLKKWRFSVSLGGSIQPVEPRDALTFAALANQLNAKVASI